MKYLIVDAALNGTGIRDKYNGGYICPKKIGLSLKIIAKIDQWLSKYERERYNGYANNNIIDKLDQEGREIALLIKNELSEVKIEYFSDARMINNII